MAGAWHELEKAWKKIEKLKQLLYAAHSHIELFQQREEQLRQRLDDFRRSLRCLGLSATVG